MRLRLFLCFFIQNNNSSYLSCCFAYTRFKVEHNIITRGVKKFYVLGTCSFGRHRRHEVPTFHRHFLFYPCNISQIFFFFSLMINVSKLSLFHLFLAYSHALILITIFHAFTRDKISSLSRSLSLSLILFLSRAKTLSGNFSSFARSRKFFSLLRRFLLEFRQN